MRQLGHKLNRPRILIRRDLRFHKWAYPVAAALFVLQVGVGQAEPVKYAFKKTGPESICEWNGYYMPLMPLPWCPARS